MEKRRFLILMSLLLALIVLSWGVDQGWAQQSLGSAPQIQQNLTNFEKAQEQAAAARAAQGLQRSITPAQRKAAAERLKATLKASQKTQNAPNSQGEVNK